MDPKQQQIMICIIITKVYNYWFEKKWPQKLGGYIFVMPETMKLYDIILAAAAALLVRIGPTAVVRPKSHALTEPIILIFNTYNHNETAINS